MNVSGTLIRTAKLARLLAENAVQLA